MWIWYDWLCFFFVHFFVVEMQRLTCMNISSIAFMRLVCTFWKKLMTPFRQLGDTWKCMFFPPLIRCRPFCCMNLIWIFNFSSHFQDVLCRHFGAIFIVWSFYLLCWRRYVWIILFHQLSDDSWFNCRYTGRKYVGIIVR